MKLTCLTLVFLFLLACETKKQEEASFDASPVSVELPEKFKLTEFDGSFRRVEKWKVDKDFIYILSEKQLFVYNHDGSLVFTVLTNEINQSDNCIISDVCSSGNKLFLLCQDKGLVRVYNKKTWNFDNAIDIGINASAIEVNQGILYTYQTPNTLNLDDEQKNYQLSLFSLEGTLINRLFPYEKSKNNKYEFSVAVAQTFAKNDGLVAFTRFLNDSVYFFNEKGTIQSYSLLNSNNNSTEASTDQDLMLQNQESEGRQRFYPIYYSFNDSIEATLFLENSMLRLRIFDKVSKKNHILDKLFDTKNDANVAPIAKIIDEKLFVLVSDESVIALNENQKILTKNRLGIKLNQLKNYEDYQFLLSINLADLQL